MNWDELTAEEWLIAEQAVLNLRSLNRVCRLAPNGHVLEVAERFAMEKGWKLMRLTIERTLRSEGQEVEKYVPPRGSVDAG